MGKTPKAHNGIINKHPASQKFNSIKNQMDQYVSTNFNSA